jgi:hypothetical protein
MNQQILLGVDMDLSPPTSTMLQMALKAGSRGPGSISMTEGDVRANRTAFCIRGLGAVLSCTRDTSGEPPDGL